MPFGDPGKETFCDMIMKFRNRDILGAMNPLITMRQELIGDDEFQHRGGVDDPALTHFSNHLLKCDKLRRYVTHNPENLPVGIELAKAIDPDVTLVDGTDNPFPGEALQNASRGLVPVPWMFDGTDTDIPMLSQVKMSGVGVLMMGSVDMCLTMWTRLESRHRTRKITREDSYRIYAEYGQLYTFMQEFFGDENRVDIAQVLPSAEPRGPLASPNMRGETGGSLNG